MEKENRKLSKSSHLPLYQQVVVYIKNKIISGEWPIGSKLPTQREFAKLFGVNRSTVVTALEELKAEGLIEGKMGASTKVVNNTWTLLANIAPPNWNKFVKTGFYKPNQSIVQEINKAESDLNIIQLGKGELSSELFSVENLHTVMHRCINRIDSLGYEVPKGLLPLRQELSKYLSTIGITCSPDSILIVSGALQALQLISVGLLRQGSTILLEEPSYLYSLHIFQSAGMKFSGLSVDNQGLIPSDIATKKQRNQSIIYTIPSFHNPTGIVMSEKRRQDLLQVCEKENLPIIEDDVYRELWIDTAPPLPLKAKDRHGQVLYIGSFSKTLSPGLRVGWLVGPEPVIDRLADIKMQIDYGSSSLSQWAATEWLSSGLYAKHLRAVRGNLTIRLHTMLEALEKHLQGIATWNIPKGGFFIWVKILPAISMQKLFETALDEGVLFYPGSIYSSACTQYLRLSYSYASLSDIKQGIYRISQIVKKLM
ncbi:PLP-dependent aminotransferase family protein [Bacillus sp. S14(2024)]|uniref:MocR-like pyridoxine biosynthesis transcription factor PdxR n=1 Tax=Bacillus sp. S14(2024) TaxID=3162884 RepID=UPI003D237AA8